MSRTSREKSKETHNPVRAPLSLFPWYGSPSLYLSLVNPFTVIRAFQRFLFFCRSELWEIISVRLLADCTQKAALESGFLLLQRLKSSGWLFFFFPPQPHRGMHTTPHHQRKKEKRRNDIQKTEKPPVLCGSIVHQGWKNVNIKSRTAALTAINIMHIPATNKMTLSDFLMNRISLFNLFINLSESFSPN